MYEFFKEISYQTLEIEDNNLRVLLIMLLKNMYEGLR